MSKYAIQLANGQKINWVTSLILLGLHIGAVAAGTLPATRRGSHPYIAPADLAVWSGRLDFTPGLFSSNYMMRYGSARSGWNVHDRSG